jgi:hypothetical protein
MGAFSLFVGVRCSAFMAAMVGALWAVAALAEGAAMESPATLPNPPTEVHGTAGDAVTAKAKHSPYHSMRMTDKAKKQYLAMWGVDKLRVSSTNSGNLIRFSYRVEDPLRAKTLLERSATPYMYSPKAQAVLQIPVMDKVGPLRQAMSPKAGQEYWMVFSNKGNLVRPGDRVDIRIGTFQADGLMVD